MRPDLAADHGVRTGYTFDATTGRYVDNTDASKTYADIDAVRNHEYLEILKGDTADEIAAFDRRAWGATGFKKALEEHLLKMQGMDAAALSTPYDGDAVEGHISVLLKKDSTDIARKAAEDALAKFTGNARIKGGRFDPGRLYSFRDQLERSLVNIKDFDVKQPILQSLDNVNKLIANVDRVAEEYNRQRRKPK